MGEQCSGTSVFTSSSTPNWWELHSSALPSWSNPQPWQPRNPPSNSFYEEDISISTSFTNASNHSGLSDDSPCDLAEPTSAVTADLPGKPASEYHLWSHVLLGIGTCKDLGSEQDDSDNFLSALTSKNLTTEMFEPPCDYSKKADKSWDFSSSPAFHSMEKQLNNYDGSSIEPERSANLTDMVNWSIAPPDPHLSRQITPSACNISLICSNNRYPEAGLISQMKQEPHNPSLYSGNGPFSNGNPSYFQCYGHDLKGENQHQDVEALPSSFTRPMSSTGLGYPRGSSVTAENSKPYYGLSDVSWWPTRHFSDLISFGGCLNKPLVDLQASSKLNLKCSVPPENKKQGQEISLQTRGNGRGTGNQSESKKKRSDDNSETLFKKPKNEGSTAASSPKVLAPKVKLGARITALQQIVSPFGKTDTASVLLEAIGYIKFLHEQVQLLSNPYLKSGASKDSWGGLERDSSEAKLDLRSRGICLVPISCTPQIYRENTGPDYWTPTYRGCLYR
ncbi:uncharacterized protein [Aristolochia californica]|uniref:uncharacterized protein n=1 Tax=Aristolochia californica TaxID=171875 RepID=UPI0035E31FFE